MLTKDQDKSGLTQPPLETAAVRHSRHSSHKQRWGKWVVSRLCGLDLANMKAKGPVKTARDETHVFGTRGAATVKRSYVYD